VSKEMSPECKKPMNVKKLDDYRVRVGTAASGENCKVQSIKDEKNRKFIALILLGGGSLSFFLSLFTQRPEMLYFCTFALLISVITTIFDSKILNSLVIAYIPLYAFLMYDAILYGFVWIHTLNFVLALRICILRYKNVYPSIIFASGIAFISYIFSFTMFMVPEFGHDYFHLKFLEPVYPILYIIIIAVLSSLLYFLDKKRSKK
jgi:hypothetical protein